MRAALRQAPKVILVGEMRDRETVEIGLSTAETGHLVMSTLHAIDAGQTINRIVGMFEQEEKKQIRIRLADTLRWVVSQRLLSKVGGGRVTEETALLYCSSKGVVSRGIDRIKKTKGEKMDVAGLKLDLEYGKRK